MKSYFFILTIVTYLTACSNSNKDVIHNDIYKLVVTVDSVRIIEEANEYLKLEPVPITNFTCERSLGTKNDFYSEGDYWWPNPDFPDSPYVKKDGLTNPENFKDHRIVMRNMSIYVASLTAAFKISKDN